MNKQKYIIVDVHPEDAYYEMNRIRLAGEEGTMNNLSPNPLIPEYVSGEFVFTNPMTLRVGEDSFEEFDKCFFYAVQLQTIEDNEKENGKVVEP